MAKTVHFGVLNALLYGLLSVIGLQIVEAPHACATCGDWLAHPLDGNKSSDDAASTSMHSTVAPSSLQLGLDDKPISQPCHGPNCRSAPPPRTPAAPLVISFHSDQLAIAVGCQWLSTPPAHFSRGNESVAHAALGFWPRIEHPPRA
jgi:hypothetical protein